MKKVLAALAVLALIGGIAYAQSIVLPVETNTNQTTDLIQVIPNGQPSAQNQYASPGQITSASVYAKEVTPKSGTGYYFSNNQAEMLIEPTAGINYLYIYLAST